MTQASIGCRKGSGGGLPCRLLSLSFNASNHTKPPRTAQSSRAGCVGGGNNVFGLEHSTRHPTGRRRARSAFTASGRTSSGEKNCADESRNLGNGLQVLAMFSF